MTSSKSRTHRGAYSAVVYSGLEPFSDDDMVWSCSHEHRTLRASRECNEKALEAYRFLTANGRFVPGAISCGQC